MQLRLQMQILMQNNMLILLQNAPVEIALLQKLRGELDSCIGCGCLSLKVCRLRNPGDSVSDQGSGPQLMEPDPTGV